MSADLHYTERADGETLVARTPDEEPFALLRAPRLRPDRRWGITFRSYGEDFGPTSQTSAPTRADAERELERTVRYASDYQLGLTASPEETL